MAEGDIRGRPGSLAARLRRSASAYEGIDRRIWVLALVRGVNTMGLSLVMAFMGVYLVTERGMSGAAYGLLYFVANLGQALANSYTGRLSDRLSRRSLMVAALTSRAAIIALLGYLVLIARVHPGPGRGPGRVVQPARRVRAGRLGGGGRRGAARSAGGRVRPAAHGRQPGLGDRPVAGRPARRPHRLRLRSSSARCRPSSCPPSPSRGRPSRARTRWRRARPASR